MCYGVAHSGLAGLEVVLDLIKAACSAMLLLLLTHGHCARADASDALNPHSCALL